MKLGFLTACLPDSSLEEVCELAATMGYEALEIAAWPALDDRPFTACHVDVAPLTAGEASRVRDCLAANGLIASSLAYYGNNLHPDLDERAATGRPVARSRRGDGASGGARRRGAVPPRLPPPVCR